MQDVHPVTITLNGSTKTYSRSFQTELAYEAGWRSVLKSAYRHAELRCECKGNGPKRLAVKYYEGTDQFDLAKFALSGAQHAPDCQFYSPPSSSGLPGSYTTGVVQDRGDGSVKIRLSIGIVERPEVTPSEPGRPAGPRRPSSRQSSMKLLGLLHYLWEEAGLNQWKPAFQKKRKPSLAYWLVRSAAEHVWTGKVRLVDQLLLPAFSAASRDATRNSALVDASLQAKHRMIIIAPLAAFTAERHESMARQLKIAGFHGMPLAFMQTGLWETAQKRFKTALTSWREGHPTIAIAQLELKQRSERVVGTVIDLALMSVTAEFIPVESNYERIVANHLVDQARAFTKPMRFDAGEETVLPDFILTDTEAQVPLEVFGRDDPGYIERKAEKTAYYNREYGAGGWWSWDASASGTAQTLPPFPAAR